MGSVTIYDIAKEAKVSPSTVSRVLTGSAKVNPAKEKVIRELMEKYDFHLNAVAKSLIDGHSRLIGLIAADIRNQYYAEVCVACEVAAKRKGYRILLRNAFSDNAVEDDSLDMFAAHRVDAVIQIGCRVDDLATDVEYAQRINRLARPFISTGKLDGANMYTYGIDNAECIRIAFEHLLGLGHERIALLGGWLSMRPTYEKWSKYIYMLGVHGIPLRQGYVQESNYGFADGFECMKRLLALDERPTAVIAINDYTAVGAISAINSHGLSCPKDISVISHDNTSLTGITTPHLTSVDYGYDKLGEGLVSTALKVINKEEVPREVYLSPTLAERDSCAINTNEK